MNPKEFVNYLNGAVEMGGLKEVEGNNFVTLKNKLNSVALDGSKEGSFCIWMQGVVDMLDEPKLSTTQFAKVVTKMNKLIMPTEQEYNPFTSTENPNSKVTFRC